MQRLYDSRHSASVIDTERTRYQRLLSKAMIDKAQAYHNELDMDETSVSLQELPCTFCGNVTTGGDLWMCSQCTGAYQAALPCVGGGGGALGTLRNAPRRHTGTDYSGQAEPGDACSGCQIAPLTQRYRLQGGVSTSASTVAPTQSISCRYIYASSGPRSCSTRVRASKLRLTLQRQRVYETYETCTRRTNNPILRLRRRQPDHRVRPTRPLRLQRSPHRETSAGKSLCYQLPPTPLLQDECLYVAP